LASPVLGFASYNPRRRVSAQLAWEINAGLLGLWAALAATLFITSGLKDMAGKPRPNLLARCDADLSKITGFTVGGFGNSIDSEAAVLVTSGICRQSDKRLLDDSFAAFPSGHSSFSCAGLVYLSLWLCARFSLAIPYLDHFAPPAKASATKSIKGGKSAPPLWQLAAALLPTVVALFICSSRYADFHHAGFDIICGAILGTVIAWASFRLYHLPMRRGRGLLAWDERRSGESFFSSASKFYEERRLEASSLERVLMDERAGGHELRDIEVGRPARISTQDSTAPIVIRQ
jgi:membrane-associated phospholipid phosphatase